jgi:hypothetical protein
MVTGNREQNATLAQNLAQQPPKPFAWAGKASGHRGLRVAGGGEMQV